MPYRMLESTTLQQLVFAVTLFVFGLSGLTALPQQDRSNWQTIKVEDLLIFQLPGGWKRPSKSVSDVHEWTRGESKLFYIQGQTGSGSYSDRKKSWMNNYEEATTRIGGQKANVRSFSFIKDKKRRYVAELNIGNWDKGQVQFFMHVEGRDPATVELAKEIFKSVRLTLPAPERSNPQ